MSQGMQVDVRVLEGPSTLAPFPAVVGEFSTPYPFPLGASTAKTWLTELLPAELSERIALPPGDVAFETLAVAVANALHDLPGPCELPAEVQRTAAGRCRILLGFCDPQATLHALRASLDIAGAVFTRAHGGPEDKPALASLARRAGAVMLTRQPDFIARALMRVARKRNIPVYPVAPGSRIWLYGQGRLGSHFFEAANHRDSFTGARLARNKYLSNLLVTRLGLPGVNARHCTRCPGGRADRHPAGLPRGGQADGPRQGHRRHRKHHHARRPDRGLRQGQRADDARRHRRAARAR